jgi:hypothetical protein
VPWIRAEKGQFNRAANEWGLFWQRALLKWQAYEPQTKDRDLAILIKEIDRDPHGCFFG